MHLGANNNKLTCMHSSYSIYLTKTKVTARFYVNLLFGLVTADYSCVIGIVYKYSKAAM